MRTFPFSQSSLDLIDLALREDLYAGDVTTDAIFSLDHSTEGYVKAKERLVVAGTPVFDAVFQRVDPNVVIEWSVRDGDLVDPGHIGRIHGPTRSVLRGERAALNFLRRLSGVASTTWSYVEALGDGGPKLVDTRKTTPGFRELEKYAVRMGGGFNHRYNLGGGAMIKDNHIAAAGSITRAVERVRHHAPFLVRIEVEVTDFEQLDEALAAGADALLLDNMSTEDMRRAVEIIDGRAIAEASGNITDERLPELRSIGLDVISSGFITHSARNFDLSLDLDGTPPAAAVIQHVGHQT